MIKEATIDETILKMEAEDFQNDFLIHHEEYWQYVNSDSFKSLSQEAKQLLFFLSSTIYNSCLDLSEELPDFEIEAYQEIEESNWTFREKTKTWSATKDLYFEDFDEEDLLAFVEDMLAEEESEISDIGKEIIFITSKSYIEYLTTA